MKESYFSRVIFLIPTVLFKPISEKLVCHIECMNEMTFDQEYDSITDQTYTLHFFRICKLINIILCFPRFEKLDITPKSAQKIKPVLERWMAEAEERYKNGVQNLTDFIGSEPSKKRKRRTSFTPQALEVLNEHFERNTHPSGRRSLLVWVAPQV